MVFVHERISMLLLQTLQPRSAAKLLIASAPLPVDPLSVIHEIELRASPDYVRRAPSADYPALLNDMVRSCYSGSVKVSGKGPNVYIPSLPAGS